MTTLPTCPESLVFEAAKLGLRFEGEQEGFGHVPAQLLFTDLDPESPAHGTTFSVFVTANADMLFAKTTSKRREFTSEKEAA